jgi:hypothetical protein
MLSFVSLHLYSHYWFSSLYFQKCVIFYRCLSTCRRVSLFLLSFCYLILFAITSIEFLDVKLYFIETLAVKISCRRFKKKSNIIINNSSLSHEVPELAIIQSLSVHHSPLLLPLTANSITLNLVTTLVQVITFVGSDVVGFLCTDTQLCYLIWSIRHTKFEYCFYHFL